MEMSLRRAACSSLARGLRAAWAYLTGRWSAHVGQAGLALFAQAVLSGMSFLTTVLLGRVCGLEELGLYALTFTVLVTVTVLQESLIGTPYTVFCQRLTACELPQYTGHALILQAGLAVIVMLGLSVACVWLALGSGPAGLGAALTALLVTIPFHLLRLFVRRVLLTRLDLVRVCGLDVAWAVLQLGSFLALIRLGLFSAVTVLLSMGMAGLIPSLIWLRRGGIRLCSSRQGLSQELRRHWKFGRWLCGSQLSDLTQRYAIHWLLLALLGVAATGLYAACATVVVLLNPLILAIGSLLGPKAAQAYRAGGAPALRHVTDTATVVAMLPMAIFSLLLIGWGDPLVQMLYQEDGAWPHEGLISLMTLTVLATTAGFAADNGLGVLERPAISFQAGLGGLALSIAVAASLVSHWGVLGAALGGFLGAAVMSAWRWAAFAQLTRQPDYVGGPA